MQCSIVVPVYLNEETVVPLIERLDRLAERLACRLEVVFVVDGSPDGSFELLREQLEDGRRFEAQLLTLSRNFGSFNAIQVGLRESRGELVAVMAADLQEPESLVEAFFEVLSGGDYDVAVGTRTSRSDPGASSSASRLFWWLYRKLVQPEIPPGGVDVFACTGQVARQLAAFHESHTSLVGLIYWLGFRRVEVPYVREARPAGESAWSVRKRIRYLQDSIFSFTSLPIAAITILGVLGVVSSLAYAAVTFGFWAAGSIEVQGYTPLMLAILFMASSVLIGLGIVGSYVWRTYENSKRRPGAITMSRELFDADGL